MAWDIEHTDQFNDWWESLSIAEQKSAAAIVGVLEAVGPTLGRPHAESIRQSRHSNMKELIIQHAGDPYRVFFAFDPRRSAILLIGGNKVGDDRFYDHMVPVADALFDEHIATIRREGLIQ